MADLDRLQQDLGFVRHAVTRAGPSQPVAIYFLWSLLTLCGFVLADVGSSIASWGCDGRGIGARSCARPCCS
jgi:hypothetical protein